MEVRSNFVPAIGTNAEIELDAARASKDSRVQFGIRLTVMPGFEKLIKNQEVFPELSILLEGENVVHGRGTRSTLDAIERYSGTVVTAAAVDSILFWPPAGTVMMPAGKQRS